MIYNLIFLDILCFSSYIYFVYHIKNIFILSTNIFDLFTNFVTLLKHLVNSISTWTYFYTVGNINVLFLIFTLIYTRVILIKFKQVTSTISTLHSQSLILNEQKFTYFRRHYISTLEYFFAGNSQFGSIFLSLLLANCPSNVFMVVVLWNEKTISTHSQFFLITFVAYEITVIFGLHLIFATASKVIYAPKQILCNFIVKKQNFKKLNNKNFVSINLFVQTFSTKKTKQIGFTYGPFGHVTLGAFTKFVLIYIKFLLITHKWMQTYKL